VRGTIAPIGLEQVPKDFINASIERSSIERDKEVILNAVSQWSDGIALKSREYSAAVRHIRDIVQAGSAWRRYSR
jgi:hypothetical protein